MARLNHLRFMASTFTVVLTATIGTTFALAVSPPSATRAPGEVAAVKPDLVISRLWAERDGETADGTNNIKVNVMVRCVATGRVVCPAFKIRVEWSDIPTSGFYLLGESGVASLASEDAASRTVPTETRLFAHTVRSGAIRYYRATVDATNLVAETNESNNVKTLSYHASGIASTDLALTQVQLLRTGESGTQFKVWIRNRGTAPCAAEIVYVVQVSGAIPGTALPEQVIANNLRGGGELGPVGTIVIADTPGHPEAFNVHIEVREGLCRDINVSNNSCVVSTPAGTDSRIVRCNT